MYANNLSEELFENYARNELVKAADSNIKASFRKTGTTIVGLIYKDGVVLGADTRATEGNIVAEKNCQKIHYIADNIYCCGAGTAADTEQVTKLISSKVRLHQLNHNRVPLVGMAAHMLKQYLFRYQGHVGAALIIGGVDPTGPKLLSIHPHGSSDLLPYVTMGSGSLAAVSVFERGFRPNMEKADAIQLVRMAVRAGIFHDMGSGSNVDLCVITKEKTEYLRTFDPANVKGQRANKYLYRAGTTPVLNTCTKPVVYDIVSTRVTYDLTKEDPEMDTQ